MDGFWVKVCGVFVTRHSDWMILSLIWSENNNLINHAVYKYPGHTRSPSHQHRPEHAAPLRCAEVSPAHCDPLIDVISWPLFCWGLEMLILFWDTAVCDNVSQWCCWSRPRPVLLHLMITTWSPEPHSSHSNIQCGHYPDKGVDPLFYTNWWHFYKFNCKLQIAF